MEKNLARREKRKEARSAKNHKKHQSWIEHQKSQKLKRTAKDANSKHVNKSEITFNDTDSEQDENALSKKPDVTNFGDDKPNSSKNIKGKKKLNKTARKTKFEEFLQIDVPKAVLSAEEDLELERRLAKKLKVKKGKITGEDDGINMLFEAIPSVLDSIHEDEQVLDTEELSIKKKHKKQKSLEANGDNLEVDALKDNLEVDVVEEEQQVPAAEESSAMKTCTNRKSSEENQVDFGIGVSMFETNDKVLVPEEVCGLETSRKRRRKKKLPEKGKEDNTVGDTAVAASGPVEAQEVETELENPVSKPTMGTSVKYVAPHLRASASNESEEHTQIRRRVRGLLNKLSESNVESVTGEMSTIFLSVGRSIGTQIISQEVLASCSNGPRGNEQYAAVFAAFVAGMACSVGMDFGAKLLASLAKSFEDQYLNEDNLSLRNLTLLLSYLCIHGVCSSELIYDFLIMLSKRLKEVDVSTILTILQCCGMKIRADDPAAMKDFILSVQNRVNELKASSGDGQGNINGKRMEFMLETICDIKNNKKRPKEDTVQHTRIKKWLQKLRVEDILIRGLTWGKLLDPDKKGQWWLSGDMAGKKENVEEVASRIDKEVLEAQKMLQLAAEQRMNTDARRAIFCIIMSGEDYIDAFEKLLRLDLPAKQDRQIMRVLVECCLQEKVFNKYYMVLASKLCEHDKNHKFTLQFCLWDHFKELESMELLRSMHLAKFVAEMISSFNLSLAVLKSVDFSDLMLLTPKRIIHFRMLFEALFEHPDNLICNIFTRIAVSPELETLRHGIEFFLKEYVVKTDKKLTKKFKVAKKALNNLEGTLL